jgi:hypothetical protein
VLIDSSMHDECMLGYILIAAVVVFLPLTYLAGADSRIDEVNWRRRRFHG